MIYKIITIAVFISAIFLQIGFAADNPMPIDISLNGDWDFTYTSSEQRSDGRGSSPMLPSVDEYTAKMPIPGYWDDHWDNLKSSSFWSSAVFNPNYKAPNYPYTYGINAPLRTSNYLKGVGFYRKLIDIPADWAERTITLTIGGARFETWVWLNGKLVGYHYMHNVPFSFSLDKLVKLGEKNELIIILSNNGVMRNGADNKSWQEGMAGIYGSVTLAVRGAAKISDCYIYPMQSNKKLKWNIELKGKIADGSFLDYSIIDKNGKIICNGSEGVNGEICSWETGNFGMKPWSEHEPNLYRIEASLRIPSGISDKISQPFGLRTLAVDGTSLKLNGKLVMLRGTSGTGSMTNPLNRNVMEDYDYALWSIGILKNLGFNWIRSHTTVLPEAYLRAADEMGMMVQIEGTGLYNEKDWAEVLRTCRKHPSVVLYCCGNEETIDDEKIEYLRSIAAIQKSLAPDGLFNPMEALRGIEYHLEMAPGKPGDTVYEPVEHNAARLKTLSEFSDVFGAFAWGWLSYAAVNGDWRDLDKKMAIYKKPLLSHENGIAGSYIDLSLEKRYEGSAIGPDMYSSARKYIASKGLLDKADTYYKNSCAWQELTHKYNVEMARKCKYITGYDFMGATDRHKGGRMGYQAGIMNEFYELKPGTTVEGVLKYNGESVVLLDCYTYRNMLPGDTASYDVMSSLYGIAPIKSGKLEWKLSSGKKAYSSGVIRLSNVEIGKIENLGKIKFTAPDLNKPAKLTLNVKLIGGEYNLTNSWDFWVFPKVDNSEIRVGSDLTTLGKYGHSYQGFRDMRESTSNLKVVSTIDAYVMKHLSEGGSVVMLGSGSFPSIATTFRLMSAGRTMGNYATVINEHPIFRNFPHEGYFDWQCYSIMEGGSAVTFNDNMIFAPIVDVVSSYKYINKQSSLFEFNVGNGRLLVCSMNLNPGDPAGNYLMNSILRYALSNEFKPKNSISMDQLKQWMSKGDNARGGFIDPGMADDSSAKKSL